MTDMLRTDWAAKFSLRTFFRAAIGGLLGAMLLAAGTPARAGDDSVPLDTKKFFTASSRASACEKTAKHRSTTRSARRW